MADDLLHPHADGDALLATELPGGRPGPGRPGPGCRAWTPRGHHRARAVPCSATQVNSSSKHRLTRGSRRRNRSLARPTLVFIRIVSGVIRVEVEPHHGLVGRSVARSGRPALGERSVAMEPVAQVLGDDRFDGQGRVGPESSRWAGPMPAPASVQDSAVNSSVALDSSPMVTAELLSIGAELLLGETVDTNAAFLGGEMAQLGMPLGAVRMVPDDRAVLRDAFTQARTRSTVVLATGGLGPTHDDLSREGLADALGEALAEDPVLHCRAGGAVRRLRTDAGGQSPPGDADPVGRDRSQPHRLRARMVGRPRRGDRRSHARRAVGDAADVERAGPPPPPGSFRPPAAGDPDGEGIRHRRVRHGRATGCPPDGAAPWCGDRDLCERRRRARSLLDPQ